MSEDELINLLGERGILRSGIYYYKNACLECYNGFLSEIVVHRSSEIFPDIVSTIVNNPNFTSQSSFNSLMQALIQKQFIGSAYIDEHHWFVGSITKQTKDVCVSFEFLKGDSSPYSLESDKDRNGTLLRVRIKTIT